MKRKREKRRSGPASDSPEIPPRVDDVALAQRFVRFAGEARTYAGPLYATLSAHIARDPELLEIARHVRRPPVANVFFAAVHFLLAESPAHELSSFYGSLCRSPRPPDDSYDAFRGFVLSNRRKLIPLLETRITQTNEVGRCSFLLPTLRARQELVPELIYPTLHSGLSTLYTQFELHPKENA